MTRMSLSPQQYTSSPARLTNTKATFQGIITLMWTAADPSSHSCYTATWQVADTHIKTHTPGAQSLPLSLSSCLVLRLSVLHTYKYRYRWKLKIHAFPYSSFIAPEDNTWMVIHHNNTDLTRVQPSPEVNTHVVHFEYASDEEQLAAIISLSEHCEQEIAYHCRKSRLLTSPGKDLGWSLMRNLWIVVMQFKQAVEVILDQAWVLQDNS